jgi:hypothetical protein
LAKSSQGVIALQGVCDKERSALTISHSPLSTTRQKEIAVFLPDHGECAMGNG